jgi:hypothetical protein
MREPPLRKTWEFSNIIQPLISYERGWPLACLEDLINPNQVNIKCFYAKILVLALIIETSAVGPWYRRSFQDICRGLWIIIAELTLFPMIFRMVFPHVQR